MFHAEFLIDDKDVVKLHYALAEFKIFNLEVKPAINAKPDKNGKAKEATATGTMPELVAVTLRKNNPVGSVFDRKALFIVSRQLGYSPNSLLVTALIKAKVIKKKGRGQFVLLASK